MSTQGPVTITSVLQAIFDDGGFPILLTAIGTVAPWVPALFQIPIIGPWLGYWLKKVVDDLIAKGVIEIKVGIINYMSNEAKKKWAAELEILKQVEDAGKILTPEQQAAYDSALQAIGQNHPGVVNS